jgi:hypothetical protein
MLGARQAVQALFISWLLISLNKGLTGGGEVALGGDTSGALDLLLRWLLVLAALTHGLARWREWSTRARQSAVVLAAIVCVLILANTFTSELASLSVLRLVQFGAWLLAVWASVQTQRANVAYWRAWITTFFVTILGLSLPLAFTGLGYFVNQEGFQGILNQPQGLGVVVAPLCAWFVTRFFMNHERTVTVGVGAVLALAFVPLSLSRNALIAAVLASAMALMTASARGVANSARGGKFYSVLAILGLVAAMPILAVILVPESIGFLMKGSEGSLSSAFYGSRGALIDVSWANFLAHPLAGIGFGIPSNLDTIEVLRDPIFGLPISAPVEKGILAIGMLEENGLPGAVLLVTLAGHLIKPALVSRPHIVALCAGCLFVNIGEAILFSLGGMGLIIWLLMSFSVLEATADV